MRLSKLVDAASATQPTTESVLAFLDKTTKIIKNNNSMGSVGLQQIGTAMYPPIVIIPQPNIQQSSTSDDKEKVKKLLEGFEQENSEAWRTICNRFGSQVKQPPLLEIATMISNHFGITLGRQARRRKSVLIKWFHDNWGIISPEIDKFRVEEDAVHLVEPLSPKKQEEKAGE